jgi:hypothetical protein
MADLKAKGMQINELLDRKPTRRGGPGPCPHRMRDKLTQHRVNATQRSQATRQAWLAIAANVGMDTLLARQRQAAGARSARPPCGHRQRLQRHALGAPALRALPRSDQGRRTDLGRHGAGGRRRAGDVRRHHPGPAGMELSLFSRDTIAMSTAVALSHNVFDAALLLGVCDKIVPGLLIGALHFGHLPCVFVPAGPMTTGLSNDDKAKVREQYAQGLVGRDALLEAESGLPRRRHLHLLRHRQQQPDAAGGHGPACAGRAFVNPGTPAARGADARGGAHALVIRGRIALHAHRPTGGRALHRQRHGRRCWPPAARPTT